MRGARLRPNAELVAARVRELKPPPAGERERLAHDLAAGRAHGLERLLEILRVEDYERPTQAQLRRLMEPADLALRAFDAGVLGAVVVELPTEGSGVKALRCRKVANRNST